MLDVINTDCSGNACINFVFVVTQEVNRYIWEGEASEL